MYQNIDTDTTRIYRKKRNSTEWWTVTIASEIEDMLQQNKDDRNRKDKKERRDIEQERTGRKETRWERKRMEKT